jgi:signal peptide peptidase SppA
MRSDTTLLLPATLLDRPWFIDRGQLRTAIEQMATRASAIANMTLPAIEAAIAAANAAPLGRMVGSVAVIPITGCITQKSDYYSWWYGGTSVERLLASFRQYQNDPAVSAIVFDIESPGGEVYGVPEAFDELFAARGSKKTIAVCNPYCCSAAYWLASACDEVVLIPSGQVGSVGAYTMHADMSKALEAFGVKITLIKYGEHKVDGNPYEPLSESAEAELQAGVDFYGQLFDKAVAKGRDKTTDVIRSTFGQGLVFRAPDAKRIGMVDRVSTLDQVLGKLAPARTRGIAAGTTSGTGGAAGVALDVVVGSAAGSAGTGTAPPPVAKKKAEMVDPDENGDCPDGYEKHDDGMCHLMDEGAKASAQADEDAVNVALALTE